MMTGQGSSWSASRALVLLMLGALLVASTAMLVLDSGVSEYCTADGILTENPPGWDLSRDQANNCEWTLFDEEGNRAPEEVYQASLLDAPPPVPIRIARMAAWLAIVVSIGGIVFVLWDARHGEDSQ